MQRLIETYLINEEYLLAEKHIRILESTLFYKNWATRQRKNLVPEEAEKKNWIIAKRKLLPVTDNPFDLTRTFPNAIAYLIDDHLNNIPAFEYGMAYILLYKDLYTLMYYMELLRDKVWDIPVLYQEAICIYYSTVKKETTDMQTVGIRQNVYDRLQAFARIVTFNPAGRYSKEFAGSYLVYYQFTPTPKR